MRADNRKSFSLGELWCRLMHDDITWPIQGYYRCQRCNRLYPVPWEEPVVKPGERVVEAPRLEPQIAVLGRAAA